MERMRNKQDKFSVIVTTGFVGHCPIENLQELKEILEKLAFLDIVYFKTTSGRLWLKEGEER